MTDLLEQAIKRVRALPAETQDDLAGIMLRLVGNDAPVYLLTHEEEADLEEADGEMARGEFATDAEVGAVFAKRRHATRKPRS